MKSTFYITHIILLFLTIAGTYYLSFQNFGNPENITSLIENHQTAFFVIKFMINTVAYLNVLIAIFFINTYFLKKGVEKSDATRMRLLNVISFLISSLAFIILNISQHT